MAGLIPAHAGKTSRAAATADRYAAHPRSRGENLIASSSMRRRSGSSPLTRGKPHRGGTASRLTGLIPAHAGKTSAAHRARGSGSAHPRSRGENQSCQAPGRLVLGSSPLTRGKPLARCVVPYVVRLIPAHAGKTDSADDADNHGEAHPRSRGENLSSVRNTRAMPGSSPLTRGKRAYHGGHDKRRGLIPAHAGKTSLCDAHLFNTSAHPRSRGENLAWAVDGARGYGSSPLTRGKRSRG